MNSLKFGLFLLAGMLAGAGLARAQESAVDLSQPLPVVALIDGRSLSNFKIISYGSTTVLAKWDGGRGTVAYAVLPPEIRQAAERARAVQAKGVKPPEPEPSTALTLARKGFVTQLVRREVSQVVPDMPPPGELELLYYQGPLGRMAAYVSPSRHDGQRHPAIIWLNGGSSNSIGAMAWIPGPPENDQSGIGFRKAGILMMYPSLRGGNMNPGYHERFYGEVDDVIAAAKYLAQLPYVDPRRIYLGGHSTGGTLALLVAESSPRFRKVYALGAVGDMSQYGADILPYDRSNPRENELRSPVLWLNAIQCETFVLEGTDKPSNIDRLRDMDRANHNPLVNFREVPGGTHFTIIGPLVDEIARQILKDTGK